MQSHTGMVPSSESNAVISSNITCDFSCSLAIVSTMCYHYGDISNNGSANQKKKRRDKEKGDYYYTWHVLHFYILRWTPGCVSPFIALVLQWSVFSAACCHQLVTAHPKRWRANTLGSPVWIDAAIIREVKWTPNNCCWDALQQKHLSCHWFKRGP